MAQRITWVAPTENTITKVEINRSSTIYGTYTKIAEIFATSDSLAKSSTNTWVVSYTDSTGTRTDWYKVRFYDGTSVLWSDYTDPVTSEYLIRLCSVEEVKRVIDTVGRWTDDEIFEAISDVDDLIYVECGTPLQSVVVPIGTVDLVEQNTYYVGEENIYRVDRVFYGSTDKSELYLDDGYKSNPKYGMIRFLSVASGGVALSTSNEVEIQYVPRIYNKLSVYTTAKTLLEKLDTTSGGKQSKELEVINARLADIERLLKNRIGLQLSSDVKYYDGAYGTNRRKVVQNFERNRYVASTGW